ncbi:MAG: hypothetical protein AB1603_03645 [Chloroflexota bacterium]
MSPKSGRIRPRSRPRAKRRGTPTRARPAATAPAAAASPQPKPVATSERGQAPKVAAASGKTPRFEYVLGDLKRIGITAGAITVVIIILALFLPRLLS